MELQLELLTDETLNKQHLSLPIMVIAFTFMQS